MWVTERALILFPPKGITGIFVDIDWRRGVEKRGEERRREERRGGEIKEEKRRGGEKRGNERRGEEI